MPLTFAHPAAVLPFLRDPLVPAALVAGSMGPDLPYFLRATGVTVTAQSWFEPFFNATTSHSLAGAPTVALPVAFLLYLGLMAAARPVATVLPANAGSRRRERVRKPIVARSGWVLVSLVLGIATHLLWDSVTHGWIATDVFALHERTIASRNAARVLQHASTVLGLLVVAGFVWHRRARLIAERGTAARARMRWVIAGAAAAGLAGAAVLVVGRWDATTTLELMLARAAVGAGLGVAVAAAATVATWWLIHLRRPRPTATSSAPPGGR